MFLGVDHRFLHLFRLIFPELFYNSLLIENRCARAKPFHLDPEVSAEAAKTLYRLRPNFEFTRFDVSKVLIYSSMVITRVELTTNGAKSSTLPARRK